MPSDVLVNNKIKCRYCSDLATAVADGPVCTLHFATNSNAELSREVASLNLRLSELQLGVERMAAYLGVMHLLKGQ